MVPSTLMLAAGLLAVPVPQAEAKKGWIVELHGYTYHSVVKAKGWTIEWQGFTKHRGQGEPPTPWIIEWQFRQPQPQSEPVETQYIDDLPAFFKRLQLQKEGEAVEAFYVNDLHAFLKSLKMQKP